MSDTNLTNPKIIDQIRSVTDISGRTVTFTYTDKGLMAKMVDGAGDPAAKTPIDPMTLTTAVQQSSQNGL